MPKIARLLPIMLAFVATTVAADSVLRVGVYSLPRGLGNPHSSTASSEMYTWAAMFDSLTTVDDQGRVRPSLATAWEALDELTWHFELRRNVQFSNGERFDAKAVVATLGYLISDQAAGESVAREFRPVESVRALDEYKVEIKTHHPTIILPGILVGMRIPAPDLWQRLGPKGFAQAPVGTGPFMLESWKPARVDLTAFEGSWRAPKIDRLEIYNIVDTAARVQALQSGKLDIALHLNLEDLEQLQRTGDRSYVDSGAGVTGLSFITVKGGPIADRRVRQALNYAIDKEAMVEVLLGGHTRPAGQPVPHNARGYNSAVKPYPYDPQRARELLAEAGYPDGFEFVAEIVPSAGVMTTPLFSYAAQQLAQIGVKMEVRGITTAQIITKGQTGTFAGSAFSMNFDVKPTLDPQRPIGMHSCLRAVPWHCDQSVMPLIEASRTEFDRDRREKLLQDLMRVFHEDPIMLYVYESVNFDGLGQGVQNYAPVNRLINYHSIKLAE